MTTRFNHPEDVKLLGRRIMEARKARGLTLKGLSERVDVHYTQISRIERGQASLMGKNMQKICKFLDIPNASFSSADAVKELPRKVEALIHRWPESASLLLSVVEAVEATLRSRQA